MPLWMCTEKDCTSPAVRNLGDCVLCGRHLCIVHVRKPAHSCPVWNDGNVYDEAFVEVERQELQDLLSRINTESLADRASELRGGIQCTIPTLTFAGRNSSVMGGMNYHVEVPFDDVVGNYIVESEVATLQFLADKIPLARTPKVYGHALFGLENSVGVGYILMDKLPGRSLRWPNDAEQRRTVMDGLADVFIELSKHPFDKMGSLNADGRIGPVARESFMDIDGDELLQNGPFPSAVEYYLTEISLILGRILTGEAYPVKRVDAYLVHLFLRDLAPKILPTDDIFYIKHADYKGDHLLVDEDFRLTGVIDWEWAHTAPAAIAFNSPIMLFDVGDFYRGVTSISAAEAVFAQLLEGKGRPDLAHHVRTGRVLHFFAFCCGNGLENDWDGFVGLFRGLRKTAKVDEHLDWDAWKEMALERYADDKGLTQLLGE